MSRTINQKKIRRNVLLKIFSNSLNVYRLPSPARPDLGHGIACLPKPHQILPPHSTCTILGWGKKRATDVHGTRILHEAQV